MIASLVTPADSALKVVMTDDEMLERAREILGARRREETWICDSPNRVREYLKMQFADGKSGEQQVLSHTSVHEMLRVQNADFPLTFQQYVGLGWMMNGIEVPGGGLVASHGGPLPDAHSMMTILPEHKLGVVILSNSATSGNPIVRAALLKTHNIMKLDAGTEEACQLINLPRAKISLAQIVENLKKIR